MKLSFANGQVVAGRDVLDGATVTLDGAHIVAIEAGAATAGTNAGMEAAPVQTVDLAGGWLVPGFIDTQVNGGGGVLFNDDISVNAIATIARAHARFGTTACLPTLISDSPDRIGAALNAVDAAIAAGVPGIVGVHIEGPFISEAKRGIHEAAKIRLLDDSIVALLARKRRGRVMLTLAPEQVDTAHVRALTAAGVLVCGGHSNATYDQTMAAVAAGVTGFTHLFNAMSPLTHRAPGVVGAALDSDSYCGLIVDNAHLHPATVRIAVRAKGLDRIMLVTDAMPAVGTDLDAFVLQGKRIAVHEGVCTYEDGTLAGSDLDMAAAFRNTVDITGLTPVDVARMASETPAAFLGLSDSHGALMPGKRADWVMLDERLRAVATWIGGAPV